MERLPSAPGAFETLLVRSGEPVFFDDHWTRFERGCRWHGFGPQAEAEKVKELSRTLAAENKVGTGVLRFAAWQTASRVEWRVEVGPPRAHMGRADFRVGWGPRLPPASADRAFKHLNRAAWSQALHQARDAGWDEAILTDPAGQLVEGCVSNIFFVQDGCLHTPAEEAGPLPGIMRNRVLAWARTAGLPVQEGVYPGGELETVSEVWFSNSLIGLRAASCLGARRLTGPQPVLELVRSGWREQYGWDPVVVTAPG
jgi:branched-subunit amino acid aminotransferase/4-amino-4-deoxychorismate lyase